MQSYCTNCGKYCRTNKFGRSTCCNAQVKIKE